MATGQLLVGLWTDVGWVGGMSIRAQGFFDMLWRGTTGAQESWETQLFFFKNLFVYLRESEGE